jgi:general secretion pathway protein M
MKLHDVRAQWQGLPPRQRWMWAGFLGILLATLLVWRVLAPALTTLRTAPAQHQMLDAQLLAMRQQRAQALAMREAVQALPPLGREEAQRALEATVRQHLGEAARLTVSAEGVTLTLSGVSGQALAQWLTQARIEARTLPTEARLDRQPNGLWQGQMTLAIPAPSAAR